MNSEAHIYAEVYKAVYAAHPGKMEPDRRREAEHCAQQAVWTFKDTQPKTRLRSDGLTEVT